MKNPWTLIDDEVKEYNKRQYENMYGSTKFVINCLKDFLHTNKKEKPQTVLDVGCSAGANLYHITREYQNIDFVGIDINNYFLESAKKKYSELGVKNATFKHTGFDEYNIKHDIIGSSQVLESLMFDDAQKFMNYCFDNAKIGVYFLALFSEKELDYEIYIHDYLYDPPKKVPYCIYSLPKLIQLANTKGFELVKGEDYNIDFDIPNNFKGRGTYTRKGINGERMQFSDVLYMPWKFLFFKKCEQETK